MTELITELEAQLAQTIIPEAKIPVMNQLAEALHFSELDRAYTVATEAYALAIEHDQAQNSIELADTLCILGYLNLLKGNIETAVTQLFQSLATYSQQQYIPGQAKASGKIGLTFSRIGNYPEALNYHLQQLKLSQEQGISHEEALAHNGIGIIHSYTETHEEALAAFQKSLQIARANDNLRQQAIALANCAHSSNHLKQFKQALAYGEQSLQLAQQTNNTLSASHALMELATTYRLCKEYDKALEKLQTNLEQLNNTDYNYPHVETLLAIGHLYNEWHKPESALPYLEEAIHLSQQTKSTYTLYRSHKEISITYQQQQDFAQALDHFQQFHQLREKVHNDQTAVNMQAMEINFQLEAARQEKETLQAQNVELEKYQNHLEELVLQRTEKLNKKNEELERFTYTVSHDLKSPLITIRGFIELLERDIERGDETKIERNIQRIERTADRMLKLLEDLLEFSRIGHTQTTLATIPLQAIILEARDLVTGRIKENNVKLIIEDDLPEVYGDYPRLVEVFQNLIENGCKFMGDQPQPQIVVGAKREGDKVLCFVRDNGIGIEPKHQDKIFKIFQRLDQSITGTGIGLALVKRIVEYHNGRIWVESEGKNSGSTFYFTLREPHIVIQEHE